MSKKLPDLNRRAPKIFDAAESQAKSIPKPRAKSKPRSGPTKRKKTILIVEKLSFDQEERIENEDLLPESNTVEIDQRVAKAMIIVGQRSNWAMAGGMLPIPMIDAAIIIGVQLSMVKKLSALYNVPFHRNRAHAIFMALIGGLLPYMAGAGLASLLGKSIPVLGWGISIVAVSILAGATTHATGVVFIQHYESGGTLFNFDPAATRDFYRQEFENARQKKTPAA